MISTFKSAIGCTALCLLLGACGSKNNNNDGGTTVNPDGAPAPDLSMHGPSPDLSTGPGADLRGQPGGLDINGAWATQVVNDQVFKGPLGMQDVVITSLALVHETQMGTTVTGMSHVCDVKLTPYKGEQTIYPPAAVAAIPDQMGQAQLSANEVGATYTPAERIQIIGWKPTGDPKTEALPKDKNDPQVYDADMDGKPGVTLMIKGNISGDVYIVNRSIIDLSGKVVDPNTIKGTSHTEQEQVVLDATSLLLKGMVTTTPGDPAKSTYTMVRLPAGMDNCAYIIANQGTLFK